MNPDPKTARQARKARRREQPGTLEDARGLLWRALKRAGELLNSEDDALSLRAVHAISQGTAAYARIVEVGELEARIAALEGQSDPTGGPQLGRGAV